MNSAEFNSKVKKIVGEIVDTGLDILKTEGIFSVKQNFMVGGRPNKWPASEKLKSAKLMSKYGNKTLIDSAAMMRIEGEVDRPGKKVRLMPGRDSRAYAYIQHHGGTINRRAGAKPIRNNKYASYRWSKGRKKGKIEVRYNKSYVINIPSRPYLLIPREDFGRIVSALRSGLSRFGYV